MAEKQRLAYMGYGKLGVLEFTPSEGPENEAGLMQASRLTDEFHRFKVISSLTYLYPPSITQLPEIPSKLYDERRAQERWISKHHPDAAMANDVLMDFLREDLEHFKMSDEMENDRPLLAVGLMPDLGYSTGAKTIPMVAFPTGESGESLRLARLFPSQWHWGNENGAMLNMSTPDPMIREASVTWTSDRLPITHVKLSGDDSEAFQWLLVQKQSSTIVLRPEYRQHLTSASRPTDMVLDQQPSYIGPNPVVIINQDLTGGRAHSDMAFIPAVPGRPPQLAIIDECGYWTIWNLVGGSWHIKKSLMRQALSSCGHISDGLLAELPSRPLHAAEKHGMLFVGRAEGEMLKRRDKTMVSSQHLILWNRQRIEIINLETNTLLPRLEPLRMPDGKADWIVDIKRSPADQNHIFILTAHYVIWVDLPGHDTSNNLPQKPSIVLACPHIGTKGDGSRMFVCKASGEDPTASLVFIHYPQHQQLCVYLFRLSPKIKLPQWHRNTLSFPDSRSGLQARDAVQLLRVDPISLSAPKKMELSDPGHDYQGLGTQFYQMTVLGKGLSLSYCLCAISKDPSLDINPPTIRFGWSEAKQKKAREKRRKRIFRHLTGTFVLPDGMTDDDITNLLSKNAQTEDEIGAFDKGKGPALKKPRPVVLNVDQFCQALCDSINLSASPEETGLPVKLFDALRHALDQGLQDGRLPLFTWKDVVEELLDPIEYGSVSDGREAEIERLLDENNGKIVVAQLRPLGPKETPNSLISLSSINQSLSQMWIDPMEGILPEEMQDIRRGWVAELARDCFLSSYGIMVQDTQLLGPGGQDTAEDSQEAPLSSQRSQASQSSSRGAIESSPARSVSPAAAPVDDAIQRLQLLVPSIRPGKLDISKQSKVLSYWPTERGVDTSEYVSSIAMANEELFRGARERLQKKEAKRKSRAEKYKRPAFMRQGLSGGEPQSQDAGPSLARPTSTQIMSSQMMPSSSQVMGPIKSSVTMSQPVPGAFGGRKKSKKVKRKTGFR